MRSRLYFALLQVVAIILSSCAVQVKTYQKPNTNLAKFDTWCWMQGCEITYQGPTYYYDKRVIDEMANAIAWNMFDKGYVQGDDQSDLILNFYTIMERDSSESYNPFWSTYQGEREWLPMLYPEYQQFMKGSLIIDVVNRETSELIWRSNAVRYLEINPSYDKKIIWKGVGKAMKKFPVKNS